MFAPRGDEALDGRSRGALGGLEDGIPSLQRSGVPQPSAYGTPPTTLKVTPDPGPRSSSTASLPLGETAPVMNRSVLIYIVEPAAGTSSENWSRSKFFVPAWHFCFATIQSKVLSSLPMQRSFAAKGARPQHIATHHDGRCCRTL